MTVIKNIFPRDESNFSISAETILDAMADGISIQDRDLRVMYQNAAHLILVGEHLGEYCFTAYQRREAACDGCHVLLSFEDGQVHRRESTTPLAGGKTVEIISTPLMDKDGRIVAGIEAVRDITASKLVEKRLLQHLAAMEASMDGMAILDSYGNYVYLNQSHADLYGYESPLQLVGTSWKNLYHEEELKRFEGIIMPLFLQNGSWRGEAVGRRQDGSSFPQELSLGAIADGGIVCVVRDIGDRKRSEEEIRLMNDGLERRASDLTLANQELESFSYSLSHDMRNYLSRISLAVQTLKEEYVPAMDQFSSGLIQMIQEAEEGMEELIRAMLELFQATRNELMHIQVDLSALARDVASLIAEGNPARKCSVVIQPDIVVDGDLAMLRILLENLLGNAWKYTMRKEDARIEVGKTLYGDQEVCFVRDNGAGFHMKDVGNLFKPFRRLHSSQDYPGTGIGLATVQRIIQRHEGEVWGEGEPGRGATFFFTLPRQLPSPGH
jgi:PAS domain S-box-containing protein